MPELFFSGEKQHLVCVCNWFGDENKKISIPAQILPQGLSGKITDLYSGDDVGFLDSDTPFTVELPPHSAKIYCIGNK